MSTRALVAGRLVTLASALVGRRTLAGLLGQTFGGDRDLYTILGYQTADPIDYRVFLARYIRQDIAGRVIDLPAQDTWRLAPEIRDGDGETEFERAWQDLVKRLRVYHYLERIDRLAGVGRYGVLLIGVRDGKPASEPLDAGTLSGPEDVLYLSPFAEGNATITGWVTEPTDERFGLPARYTLQMGNYGAPGGSQATHWSRVLHVADDLLEDDVYGRPRLERVLNRLDDLEKIVGGGSEAAWRTMDRGMQVDVDPEHQLSPEDEAALEDQFDEYIHNLRRILQTRGVTVTELGGGVVNPTGLFEIITSLIASASDIPKRILLGSERGELASSQDEANWARTIASRQTSFAEPVILRPFIDRLIMAGALPEPQGGEYEVVWPSLFSLNDQEKANVYSTLVGARADPETAARLAGYGEEQAKELAKPAPQLEQPPGTAPETDPNEEPATNRLRTNEGEPSPEELEMQAALEAFFDEWQGTFAEAVAEEDEPDWEAFAAALALLLLPLLQQAATNRAIALGVETGVAFDTAQVADMAAQWARGYSFELVKGLTDTTRKLVSRAVEQYALNPAMTVDDVARLIEPAFGKVRAQRIASTEVTRAYSEATLQYQRLLQQQGVRTVPVWRTLPGACALVCLPLEGKKQGEWGVHAAGPPGHTGCRCRISLEPAEQ